MRAFHSFSQVHLGFRVFWYCVGGINIFNVFKDIGFGENVSGTFDSSKCPFKHQIVSIVKQNSFNQIAKKVIKSQQKL